MAKPDGGPAFPLPGEQYDDGEKVARSWNGPGMSLRDYFAAQALPAVMEEYFRGNGTCIGTEHAPRNCVAHAYKFADAMLAAREK